MTAEPVVHIIDDDEAVRDSLSLLLTIYGFKVQSHPSADAYLASAQPASCGCILADVQMGGMSGLDLLARIRAGRLPLPVILMTGRPERRVAAEAEELGALAVLDKPFGPGQLVGLLCEAIRSR